MVILKIGMYVLLLSIYITYILSQVLIGFPEIDDSETKIVKRDPLYVPARCDSNEYLYPGDLIDDWICDCKPGYIYYPPANRCYPVYREGPCKYGEYLTIKHDNVIPSCEPNPCKVDRYVRYNNKCLKLYTHGDCPWDYFNPMVLSVNSNTLQLECQHTRIFKNNEALTLSCAPGTKRRINGTCGRTLKLVFFTD